MDLDDSICFLDNNFDPFHSLDCLNSMNRNFDPVYDISGIKQSNSSSELDQLCRNMDFGLNYEEKVGGAMDDFSKFDTTELDTDFMQHIVCDNSSSISSDSGNSSPLCSSSDACNPQKFSNAQSTFKNEPTNDLQPAQSQQWEAKITPVPDPSRLIPVHIPVKNIVTSNNNSSHPVICIVPATSSGYFMKSNSFVSQTKQHMLSPKYEAPSPAPTLIATPNNLSSALYGQVNTVFNTLAEPQCGKSTWIANDGRHPSVSNVLDEFDRKKENRKLRNRYSAQLSRIRKRNQMEDMKRNLASKDAELEKLKGENDELKKIIQSLRKENEMLKSNGHKQNNGSRLGIVAGVTCFFALFSFLSINNNNLRNVVPTRDETSFVNVNALKSNASLLKSKRHIGRALLSYDYEEYKSSNKPRMSRKLRFFSQPDLNRTENCGNAQKKYLNRSETIRLNDDVFAWVNRHECLKFMHIRRIFRLPVHGSWEGKSIQKTAHNVEGNIESRQERTAIDKIEDARMKAVRERAWRHIDLISSTGDSGPIKPQIKTMDYDVEGRAISNWMHSKADGLAAINMESLYAEFARNLKQREDTLYVVSMKDYYLLPPTDRNSTVQPRMALILPALSFNSTLINQIAMMRLECDITGTGLFHLPNSLLPLFYDRLSSQ